MERAYNKTDEQPVKQSERVQNSLRFFVPSVVDKFQRAMAKQRVEEADFGWSESFDLLDTICGDMLLRSSYSDAARFAMATDGKPVLFAKPIMQDPPAVLSKGLNSQDVCQQERAATNCAVHNCDDHSTEQCRAVWRALGYCLEKINSGSCDGERDGTCKFFHSECNRGSISSDRWNKALGKAQEWFNARGAFQQQAPRACPMLTLPADEDESCAPVIAPACRGSWFY